MAAPASAPPARPVAAPPMAAPARPPMTAPPAARSPGVLQAVTDKAMAPAAATLRTFFMRCIPVSNCACFDLAGGRFGSAHRSLALAARKLAGGVEVPARECFEDGSPILTAAQRLTRPHPPHHMDNVSRLGGRSGLARARGGKSGLHGDAVPDNLRRGMTPGTVPQRADRPARPLRPAGQG